MKCIELKLLIRNECNEIIGICINAFDANETPGLHDRIHK